MTPLQKLPNNVSNLGKIIVATGFECLPKKQTIAQSGHTARQRRIYLEEEERKRKKRLNNICFG